MQPTATDEEEVADPTAASSGEGAQGDAGQDGEASDALLPVTGLAAPDMWGNANQSRAHDLSVEDFLATPLAGKFYNAWKNGEVKDGLIGERFGYGVLGGFEGKRDWENGVFQEEAADSGGARDPAQEEDGGRTNAPAGRSWRDCWRWRGTSTRTCSSVGAAD